MALTKIVSGGQTGVDRGALDAALAARFQCGGWCPADRRAEDGPIPQRYPMTALAGAGYSQRTRQNVIDSDGTAILFYGTLSSGTKLTRDVCVREKKPFTVLDAKLISELSAAAAMVGFVAENEVAVLNVAGPRLSGWPQGHEFAFGVVGKVISGALTGQSLCFKRGNKI